VIGARLPVTGADESSTGLFVIGVDDNPNGLIVVGIEESSGPTLKGSEVG
jgi:hypothetical protein